MIGTLRAGAIAEVALSVSVATRSGGTIGLRDATTPKPVDCTAHTAQRGWAPAR